MQVSCKKLLFIRWETHPIASDTARQDRPTADVARFGSVCSFKFQQCGVNRLGVIWAEQGYFAGVSIGIQHITKRSGTPVIGHRETDFLFRHRSFDLELSFQPFANDYFARIWSRPQRHTPYKSTACRNYNYCFFPYHCSNATLVFISGDGFDEQGESTSLQKYQEPPQGYSWQSNHQSPITCALDLRSETGNCQTEPNHPDLLQYGEVGCI